MTDRININRKEYQKLLADSNYTNVQFNELTGGLMATHKEHCFDTQRGWCEIDVQRIGYEAGNSIIFEKESGENIGTRYTEGTWNGKKFEIASKETATSNNIKKGLNHCASKPNVKIAVLYFPNNNFDVTSFDNAIARYNGLKKALVKGCVDFEEIICIDKTGIIYKKSYPKVTLAPQAHKGTPKVI